jgi:hypothetical protein
LTQDLVKGNYHFIDILENRYDSLSNASNALNVLFNLSLNFIATFEDNVFNELKIGKLINIKDANPL